MPVNKAGYRSFAVDAANAVEWDHPLNRSLAFWYNAPPGVVSAGGRWLNLCDSRSQSIFIPGCGFGYSNSSKYGPGLSLPDSGHSLAAATLNSGLVNTEVTISGWGFSVNNATGTANPRLLSMTGATSTTRGLALSIQVASGAMRFLVGNGTALNTATINPTAVPVNRWVRWYGVTRNTAGNTFSATLYEYQDGAGIPTVTTTTGISGSLLFPTTFPLFIGNSQGTNDSSTTTVGAAAAFRGMIDDVKGWNRALSADEIQADYQQSSARYQTVDSPLRWFSTRSYSLPSGGGTNRRRRVILGGGR